MKFQSQIIASGSGSVGGCTWSRNRYGQYIRRRAMPIFPATAPQLAITTALAALLVQWRTLTALVQDAWTSYALTAPRTDPLGQSYTLTGQAMFIACNVPRIQAGFSVITAGPVLAGEASMTPPGITSLTASTRVAIVTFTTTDIWDSSASGRLNMYSSRPQPTSVNFFKGPWRLAGGVVGAVTPTTSPQNITTPFALGVGQRVFVRFRAFNADGRLTNQSFLSILAV